MSLMKNTQSVRLGTLAFLFAVGGWLTPAAHAQSSRFAGQLGSMVYRDTATGVTFRVWAPNASSVGVKGQFNGWATTPMVSEGGSGYWSVDVNGAQPGQEYKYRLNNNTDKRDPRARRVTNSNGNSVIYDTDAFDWGDTPIPMPWRNDLVVYQMHLGTFGGQNPPSNFDQAIARLDHVRNLGISVIKLMPVAEFAGGRSWGYNPADLFAIESDYGGPDAFKRFMKAAHERGISVFMDVVHNHYGPSDLDMWQFDGWSQNNLGGIYFYNDGRAHTMWGSTRPDYGRSQVRDFVRDQIYMYVDEYRIGGFRWDSVYFTINSDWGHNQQGEHMLRDINWDLSQSHPHVERGAEDNAFDFSMNFQNQWDVAYRWGLRDTVVSGSDAERNMNTVKGLLDGWAGHHRVVFSEAHDYVAATHGRSRIPTEVHSGDPESIFARKRSLLAAGIVMTTPGIPMIFQGQEMLETQAFHDDTALRWNRTNTFAGIVRAYSDLIHSRRNLRGGMQGLKGTGVHVHHVNNTDKVIAYVRWDAGGQTDDVLVVANFSNNDRLNYSVPFPSDGTWYSHFNSDSIEYQSDFGGLGPSQVTVSGGQASMDLGRYSLQIFSKDPPSGTGQVSFDPPAPNGCVDVAITFDPADGPLEGTTNVVIHLGRNDWQDVDDLQMYHLGNGTWALTVTVAEATAELNMAFFDGDEEGVWDTNEGMNWRLAIANCAGLPGIATVDPEYPHGCVPVTITYKQRDGALAAATNIFAHVGRNGWVNIQTLALTNTVGDEWETTYLIPQGTWQLDFVFHDGAPDEERIWDNNNWNDWQVFVLGCVVSDAAGLSITNPVSDILIPYTQSTHSVLGRANRLVGHLNWENQLTGETGQLAVSTNWSVLSIPLDLGANLIRVTGTNSTDNLNAGARDSATNALYVADGWLTGQNGGTGWGGGWELSTAGSAGHFLASGAGNQDTLPYAWGLWANSGGVSAAVRPFADQLHAGDEFRVRMENNEIQDGGVVGIGLQNRFGQNLFEFFFVGGESTYWINDNEAGRDTGIGWTDQGLDLTFELTSPTTYRFTANATEVTGTLAATSEALIYRVRLFNANAGDGWQRDAFFSNLEIDGLPLESSEYQTSRTINRRFGPHFQTLDADDDDAVRIRFPVTETGYQYDVHHTTNLVTGPWITNNFNLLGAGPPLTVDITNAVPQLFIRTSVKPVD